MPRSNQTGGGGPRGSGPRGGGQRPPDLEEFLRRSQDRLRNVMPGNLGGRGIALIVLVALALWGFSGFYTVGPPRPRARSRQCRARRDCPASRCAAGPDCGAGILPDRAAAARRRMAAVQTGRAVLSPTGRRRFGYSTASSLSWRQPCRLFKFSRGL